MSGNTLRANAGVAGYSFPQTLDKTMRDRKHLVAAEVEKLMEAEVQAKAPETTPKEIDDYYEQNKARFGTQAKEQVVPQISGMLRESFDHAHDDMSARSLREQQVEARRALEAVEAAFGRPEPLSPSGT